MRLFLAALIVLAVAPASAMASRVGTADSSYGPVLVTGKGLTLYAFTYDGRGPSKCFGDCATAWPPFLTKRKPTAVGGAKQKYLGTVRRGSQLQVTYRGRPLYRFVGETAPGQILCQNAFEYGGYWRIVKPGGALITSPPA